MKLENIRKKITKLESQVSYLRDSIESKRNALELDYVRLQSLSRFDKSRESAEILADPELPKIMARILRQIV